MCFHVSGSRQELHILQILAQWFLSGLLPTSTAIWKLSPKFQGIHRVLVRRTVTTHSIVGPCCCMGREMQRSQGKLCREPVQTSVASVSLSSQFARSLQKAICLLANLSTLPKYSRSWLQFYAHGVDPRVAPRFSQAADQEREGSSDWATMHRCSAFCAPVTNTRRTRRNCGKI